MGLNGSSSVSAATTLTLGTATRISSARWIPALYVDTDTAGIEWAAVGILAVAGQPECGISLVRTAIADQGSIQGRNSHISDARTFDYGIWQIVP